MSYILEALKKAQAERQLGNAPTIHAPQPVQVNAAASGPAANRKPLLLGLGAGALVVVLGAALMWHRGPAPDAQKLAQASPSAIATPLQPAAPAPAPAGAATATLAVRAPDTPPPAPRMAEPRAVPAAPAPAPRAGTDARVASAAGVPSAPAYAAQPQPAPPAGQRQPQPVTPAPVSASTSGSAPAPEDSLPLVQQLPDTVRSQLPRVHFGGYMYSANPADRLVLVDNVLRHEGEEVAPGLVLEKLMPKAAVMNFRGVRYRVAY
jgi:general secretion pathway protein B